MLILSKEEASIYTSNSIRHTPSSNKVSCVTNLNLVLPKGGWFSDSVLTFVITFSDLSGKCTAN